MKESMPNLVDAAHRMKVLMDTAKELEASPPDVAEFEIAAREYTRTTPWRRPKLFGNKQEVSKETPEQTATGETGEPSSRSEAASSRPREETESSDDSKESEEKATPLPSEEVETDVSNMQAKTQSSDAGLCGIPQDPTMPSRDIYIGDELLQTFEDGTGVITFPARRKILAA
jgi:hypothetical protein